VRWKCPGSPCPEGG